MGPAQVYNYPALDSRPHVSVIIPCFNHGSYIRDAIASVRCQTYGEYEIIIVNDGSTDRQTCNTLNELADSGLRVIHTINQGVAAARNTGISQARGDLILPLDADDRIAPSFLEHAVPLLDSDPLVGAVFGEVEFFGEASGIWQLPDYSPTKILLDNMIVDSAVFRRADWQRIGGYREEMRHGWEDWDFWLSFVELGRRMVKLPQVLFYYRIRGDSRNSTLSAAIKLRLFGQLVCNHKRLYFTNTWNILGMLFHKKQARSSISHS